MKIIERIFEELKKQNKKDIEISKQLKVTTAQIAMWKKRKTDPPAKYIKQIAELLGVSTDYLLTGENKCVEKGKSGFEAAIFNAPPKEADIKALFNTDNVFTGYASYIFESRNELYVLKEQLLNISEDKSRPEVFSALIFKQCVISLFFAAKIMIPENEFRNAAEIFLKNPSIKEKYDKFIFNWEKSKNREFFGNLKNYITGCDENIYFDKRKKTEKIKKSDIGILSEFDGSLYDFNASAFFEVVADIYVKTFKTKVADYEKITDLSKKKITLFIGEAFDLTDAICREFFENYSVEKEKAPNKCVIMPCDDIPYIKSEKEILKVYSENDDYYTEAYKAAYGGSKVGGKNPDFDNYKIILEITDDDE